MKSTFVKTTKSTLNYTMRSITLRKTSCIYPAHIFEDELFPRMAAQQSQQVDAAGCLILLAG
jgi:hypothetical protein